MFFFPLHLCNGFVGYEVGEREREFIPHKKKIVPSIKVSVVSEKKDIFFSLFVVCFLY